MIAAPILLSFIPEDIILIEIIKILVGATIGAAIIQYRTRFLTGLINLWNSMKKFVKGIQVLGSEEFQKLPVDVKELKDSNATINRKVEFVYSKVGPNGGGSLLDGVNALQKSVKTLQHSVKALMLNGQQLVDASGTLMFRLTTEGHFSWASKALQELVGLSFEDGFKNQQWENLYFQEDLPDIRRRWNDAVAISRSIDIQLESLDQPEIILTMRTRFRHSESGSEIPVNIRLSKMPDGGISGIVTTIPTGIQANRRATDIV